MDNIFFRTLITKSLVASKTDSDERFFEGVLTVEMKDKQGEITIVDELFFLNSMSTIVPFAGPDIISV